MRFFCYTMGDESIPTPPPTAEAMEAMGKLVEESIKSGWLIQTGGFAPTSDAVKVRLVDGKFTTIDGPFAEAKELIGGWPWWRQRRRKRQSNIPRSSWSS